MNLSDAIEELIVAVRENTATMQRISGAGKVPPCTPEQQSDAQPPTASVRPEPEPAAAPAPVPSKPAKAKAPAEMTYEENVRPLALKVAGTKGRDALVALFTEFGVKSGPALKPEQFAAFIARCNEVLA